MDTSIAQASALLFSASNLAELALRIGLAALLLQHLGYLLGPQARLLSVERILVGVLLAFYLVYAGSILARGQASSIPAWLLALATAGGVIRRVRSGRHARGLALGFRGFLFFAVYLCLLLRADWPRFVPMSSDSHLYTWLTHQISRYGVVPFAQPPVGPEPFHYPAGVGILGYVLGFFSLGLKPLETIPLLASLLVFWFGLFLWRSASSRREGLLLLLGLVGLAWGILYPHREHAMLGRTLILPFLLYVALRPFRLLEARAWPWLLAGLGPFLVSLNPAVAPFVLLVFLLSTDHLARRQGFSTWEALRPGRLLLVGLPALLLVVFGDPYFRAHFNGVEPRQATFENGRPLSLRLDYFEAARGLLFAFLRRPFATIEYYFGRGLTHAGWLALFAAVPLLLTRLFGHAREARRLLTRILAGSLLFFLFLASFRFSGERGALYLLPDYNRQIFGYFLWGIVLLTGGVALDRAMSAPTERKVGWRRVVYLLLALTWFVGPLHGLAGLLARPHRVFPKLDPATARVLLEVAQIWKESPRTKILTESYDPDLEGEQFLYIYAPVGTAAYLPNSNPAFFYFQGDRNYSYPNYMEHVCRRFDREWLKARGIDYVLVAPARHPRCATLPESKSLVLFRVEDVPTP